MKIGRVLVFGLMGLSVAACNYYGNSDEERLISSISGSYSIDGHCSYHAYAGVENDNDKAVPYFTLIDSYVVKDRWCRLGRVSKDSEGFKIFSAYETCQRYLEYGTGEVGESEEVTAFSVWVARTGKDKIRLIESGQDEVDLVKCR